MTSTSRGGWYARAGKRAFDVVVASVLLLIALPLLLLAALLVRVSSPGPIFFRQRRLGRHGTEFDVLKFRSMTHEVRTSHVERHGVGDGVTAVGHLLRRTKLDELPQLLNVLVGDMSLVGPRPALPSQRSEYDAVSVRRLDVRPGMTGLAQVHGNIHLTWPERWRWDVAYVDHVTLLGDLAILARTVLVVLLGEGRFFTSPPTSRGHTA